MKTLRFKLFVFYLGSLTLLAVFFYVVVHTLALPHATHTFLIILAALTVFGFIIIYNITASLTHLTSQIKKISSTNLHTHVRGITGEDEISHLAKSFNGLLDRLNEAFTRERQFIGDMAHELKTPIAIVRSTIEVTLAKKRTADEYEAALKQALAETEHLSMTLNDVLDLAWSESPQHTKQMPKLNLSTLLEELVEITHRMADQSPVTIKSSIKKNVMIQGYKEKLARAILNISDNALKYTAIGTVTISLTSDHSHAILQISDTGPGIPENDLPHVFERFFQGTRHREGRGHAGLGLAIVQRVATLHGGWVKAANKSLEQGQGAVFSIWLPAA